MFKTIRVMISIVVNFNLELEKLDVKIEFLHSELDEHIYISQPTSFIDIHHPNYGFC